MKPAGTLILASLLLAACGSNSSTAESTADNLEAAADQSNPAAADVLENKADQIRETGTEDPAAAQSALEAAGNAQAPAGPASGNTQ
jgi:PBP1b-binding outer membrane lipoprotein LpoB